MCENVADTDGLKLAYLAWKLSNGWNMTEPKDIINEAEFSPEHLFFISFAQVV